VESTQIEPQENEKKEMAQQCDFEEIDEPNTDILREANLLMSKTSRKFVNLSIGAPHRKFSIPNQEIKF